MKKFIFIFIFFFIIAAVLAYFGWVNIPDGSFGITHSKITGTIDYPLSSDKFYWFWQKLIPKSFSIYTIKNKPYTFNIKSSKPLPGSDNLKEFGNFNLELSIDVKFEVDFNVAKTLLKEGITNDFDVFFKNRVSPQTDEIISNFILENIKKYSINKQELSYDLLDNLKLEIKSVIEENSNRYNMKDTEISIDYIRIPQLDMYSKAIEKYFRYLEISYSLKEEELKKESEYKQKMMEDNVEIEKLKKYGELISQYPDMLKYFYIQKFGEKAEVIVLPQDEKTGFPRMFEKEKESIPQNGVPEQKIMPEEEKAFGGVESKEEEIPKEPEVPKKEKWYEYLKFWKYLKKE